MHTKSMSPELIRLCTEHPLKKRKTRRGSPPPPQLHRRLWQSRRGHITNYLQNLLLQRSQSHHFKGLFQTLKHWSCCRCWSLLVQLITLLRRVQCETLSWRQQFRSSGITLLLVFQKTHLFVCSKRDTDRIDKTLLLLHQETNRFVQNETRVELFSELTQDPSLRLPQDVNLRGALEEIRPENIHLGTAPTNSRRK